MSHENTEIKINLMEEIIAPVTKQYNKGLGCVELVSAILGLVLNTLALVYFLRKVKHPTSKMYLMIVSTDILICFSSIPASLAMLRHGRAGALADSGVCNLTGLVFFVASRMSIFLIALLSTARTVSLVSPFLRQKWWIYILITVVYFIGTLLCGTMPFYSGRKYGYHYSIFFFCTCDTTGLDNEHQQATLKHLIKPLFVEILPWLVPGVVICVSCVQSISAICRSTRHNSYHGSHNNQAEKKYATVTIVIVTLVCIVFNIPQWAFALIQMVDLGQSPDEGIMSSEHMDIVTLTYLAIWISRISVVMNSFVNSVVYFWRMKRLRVLFCSFGVKREYETTRSSTHKATGASGISLGFRGPESNATRGGSEMSLVNLPSISHLSPVAMRNRPKR